jgi:hypothetical protein
MPRRWPQGGHKTIYIVPASPAVGRVWNIATHKINDWVTMLAHGSEFDGRL